MAKMLMGAFKDRQHADEALAELEDQGYTPEEISVISSSQDYTEKGYNTGAGGEVAKSAGSGAVTGGVIGGVAGLLAGAGAIPALAGLFIGGPIVAALGLAGVAATTAAGAVTGAAAGGLIGALMGLGVSKETATSYDSTVREGGVVIGLTGHGEATVEAKAILEQRGATDVNVIELRDSAEAEAGAGAEGMQARDAEPEMSRKETSRETRTTPAASRQPAFGERRDLESRNIDNARSEMVDDQAIREQSDKAAARDESRPTPRTDL